MLEIIALFFAAVAFFVAGWGYLAVITAHKLRSGDIIGLKRLVGYKEE